MGTVPVRDLEVDTGGANWSLLIGVSVVVALLVLVWKLYPEQDPAEVEAPVAVEARAPVAVAVEAAPLSQVRVETSPSGGRVSLDGRSYGMAPVPVPVPQDKARHTLCVELGGVETCREITGSALSVEDPYVFELGSGGGG
jgi:hypothetical protein